jgi:glycosyltransferase involved in cell wall biosynthesis
MVKGISEPILKLSPLTSPYRLVFIGNFNQSNLEATVRVVNALKNDLRFEMYFYTAVPNFLLKIRGVDVDCIVNKGYISDNVLIDELKKYDVCMLTHGFTGGYTDVEYKTIFPTRTIPFLLSGKPVFAHSPAQSFLNEFIMKNECAMLVEEPSENLIKESLLSLVSDDALRTRLVNNAQRTATQFDGKNVVQKLIDSLQNKTL